jgi:hypothetical protein
MKRLLSLLLLSIPQLSFAFLCPSNFNQIDYGMTVADVTKTCGAPASTKQSVREQDNMPQEWTYYVPQTVSFNTLQQSTGTMKTSFAVDANGHAVNISVNGLGVGATTICGSNVQLGDSRDAIKSACGNPSFINKQNGPGSSVVGQGSDQNIQVTDLLYNGNPPVTLEFENGILKDRK